MQEDRGPRIHDEGLERGMSEMDGRLIGPKGLAHLKIIEPVRGQKKFIRRG